MFADSSNFLVQELFQCKLTRKGTIAPSDRQSKLRKSLNTFSEYDAVSIAASRHASSGIHSNEANTSLSQISTVEGGTPTIVETLTSSASMNNKIKFLDIYKLVSTCVENRERANLNDLETICQYNIYMRTTAKEKIA